MPSILTNTLTAAKLHRMVYNILKFQSVLSAPPAFIHVTDYGVGMEWADNHSLIRDTEFGVVLDVEPFELMLSATSVREVEKWLRDQEDDTPMELRRVEKMDGGIFLEINKEWYDSGWTQSAQDVTEQNSEIMDDTKTTTGAQDGPFAVDQGMWRKLALLKPGDDYPVDFLRVEHEKFGELIYFKHGPTVEGALTILDREVLHNKAGSGDFLW